MLPSFEVSTRDEEGNFEFGLNKSGEKVKAEVNFDYDEARDIFMNAVRESVDEFRSTVAPAYDRFAHMVSVN